MCYDLSCSCREKKDLDNQEGRCIKSEQRGIQSSTNLLGRQLINISVYLEQDVLRSNWKKSLEGKLKKSVNDESKYYSEVLGKHKNFFGGKIIFL